MKTESVYQRLVKKGGFSAAQKIIIDLLSVGEVLEIGSSSGYMTKEFTKKGCRVDVLDVDRRAVREAARFARRAITGSIEDAGVQRSIRGHYDFVVCADVLEHLADPKKVLLFLHRKLKKNGQILISIPNIAFWDMRLELLKGRFEYKESGLLDRTHLRFYTYNTFQRLLEETGFKITGIYPAEGRIPFEYTLRRVPLLGQKVMEVLKPILMRTLPNLTYYHYVLQAKR